MLFGVVNGLEQRVARMVEKTNDLLGAIDYFVVADAAGISQSHSAPLRIFSDVLDAN